MTLGGSDGGSAPRRLADTTWRTRLMIGSLCILVMVSAGIVALFALHYDNLQQRKMSEALRGLDQASQAATEARVAFKLQVQEWKNTLLRGRDQGDYGRYRAAMETRGTELRTILAALAEDGSGGEGVMRRVREILAAHDTLQTRYREALARFEESGRTDPWSADALVRGADRPIDESLDALAAHFATEADAALADGMAAAARRYEDLRLAVLIANGLGILLLLLLLLPTLLATARR